MGYDNWHEWAAEEEAIEYEENALALGLILPNGYCIRERQSLLTYQQMED